MFVTVLGRSILEDSDRTPKLTLIRTDLFMSGIDSCREDHGKTERQNDAKKFEVHFVDGVVLVAVLFEVDDVVAVDDVVNSNAILLLILSFQTLMLTEYM